MPAIGRKMKPIEGPWRRPERKLRDTHRYERHVLSPGKRQRLMEFLKEKEKYDGLFDYVKIHLDKLGGEGQVHELPFEGVKVVIKDTADKPIHGADYQSIREKAVLSHQLAVREKKGALSTIWNILTRKGVLSASRYRILTPKVYGKIGRFLVMEYMEGPSYHTALSNLSNTEANSLKKAYEQMNKNFNRLSEKGLLKNEIPQLGRFIVLGNTNPLHPNKGKWLFATVYDIG